MRVHRGRGELSPLCKKGPFYRSVSTLLSFIVAQSQNSRDYLLNNQRCKTTLRDLTCDSSGESCRHVETEKKQFLDAYGTVLLTSVLACQCLKKIKYQILSPLKHFSQTIQTQHYKAEYLKPRSKEKMVSVQN